MRCLGLNHITISRKNKLCGRAFYCKVFFFLLFASLVFRAYMRRSNALFIMQKSVYRSIILCLCKKSRYVFFVRCAIIGLQIYKKTAAKKRQFFYIFLYVFISAFFVIKFFSLIFGFASKPYSKARENVHINARKNYRRVHFAVAQLWQLAECKSCVVRGNRANR